MVVYEYLYLQFFRAYDSLGGTFPYQSAKIALSISLVLNAFIFNYYTKELGYTYDRGYLVIGVFLLVLFNLIYFSENRARKIVARFKNERLKVVKSIFFLTILIINPMYIMMVKMP